MREHWTVLAMDRTTGKERGIIGQGDDGEFYVPSKTRPNWWDRRLNLRNPAHWRYWLKSRLTRKVAFLEMERV